MAPKQFKTKSSKHLETPKKSEIRDAKRLIDEFDLDIFKKDLFRLF